MRRERLRQRIQISSILRERGAHAYRPVMASARMSEVPVTLRPDRPTQTRGHVVRLVEAAPGGEPRPWARVQCD